MLEKYHDEMLSCTACAFCKKSYYVYKFAQKESDYPKGKVMVCYGLFSKEIEEDMDVVKILQKCTLCRRCEKDCPSMIKISDIIWAGRYDLKNLLPEHEKMLQNFEKYNNIFGEKNYEKEGSEITFFMGCLVSKEMKDVVISLFDKLGIDVTVIGGCCGYPIEKIGRRVKIKLIEKEMDKLIFSCPNGMLAFKEFKPMHISQFILSLNVNFLKNNKNYIYHDSSFLGRYLGIYDEPREIIKRIGNLVEFEENREMARQCGGEIEFKIAFPQEAGEMAEYLAREAKKKDAIIVTTSPHCYSHLKEYGDVVDLLQLVEENIK
ncbi:hypothetical protein B6U81_03960 [Thermoplasmatales archaeon ex4484_30]|nr:MAG: (Fe-S)-binding protein [Thermoplasmata archaeon]OYT61075.1 MAG: hypothetical protein B6U81_03960 [Thermoplasmatales archaeon ex4484_30]